MIGIRHKPGAPREIRGPLKPFRNPSMETMIPLEEFIMDRSHSHTHKHTQTKKFIIPVEPVTNSKFYFPGNPEMETGICFGHKTL